MKRNIRWILTITLLLIVVVLVYYKSVNKEEEQQEDTTVVQDTDKLLSKDLAESYPVTVCQVVQLFTRIQKCYYNEDCSNEDIAKLAAMAMQLFDDELVANNPTDEYLSDLEEEINLYRKNNKTISRVLVGKSSEVTYSTVDGVKYASLECIYYVKDDSSTEKTITTYILRKDENDKWKILGWQEFVPSEWEE